MTKTRYTTMDEYVWMEETSPFYKDDNREIELFNPDLEPLQNPILRYGWTDIMQPEHRERLGQYSKFLQKQVLQKFQELNYDGWSYKDKTKTTPDSERNGSVSLDEGDKDIPTNPSDKAGAISKKGDTEVDKDGNGFGVEGVEGIETEEKPLDSDEWTDELKEQTAIATYLACVVDTAFLMLPKDKKTDEIMPKAVSRNWCKDNKVVGDSERRIKSTEIRFPQLEYMYKAKDKETFAEDKVEIFTQFSDNPNSVVIQPRWNISTPFGECILKPELQTAYEKMYLRFYEMLSLHKAGIMSETYVIPKSVDDEIATRTKAEMKRGMAGFGRLLKVPTNTDLNAQFKYEVTEMGKLDFATIASHINQDVDLSKQSMEGGGGQPNSPNPFSGLAPLMSEQSDTKLKDRLSEIYKKVIKDVNFVLFKKDPKTYDIEFQKSSNLMQNQDIKDEFNRNERKEGQIKDGEPAKAFGKPSGEQPNRKSRGY